MQTYLNKRKAQDRAASPAQEQAPSRSEMLHLSGAGAPQPMSPQLREKFEPGFGADFSNIRISRGHIPDEMGVQAVAQGTDILLDQSAGMDVLGHELAHVVQQAQGRVDGGFPVVENAALEQEADVMGARVASGLTAQAGPQNGFGGEMISIAPMSSASAPAQCKSREEKAREKMQISAPTQVQIGTAGYHNAGLSQSALKDVKQNSTIATSHDVATSQMLGVLNQDPAYVQRVADYTHSTPTQIATDMGTMVGQDYAASSMKMDPGVGTDKERFAAMFRPNDLHHRNFGEFVQGQADQGTIDRSIQAAQAGTMEQRPSKSGKAHQDGEMDMNTVNTQLDALISSATGSAPTMSMADSFFRTMKQSGSTISDAELEKKMSSSIMLRGYSPLMTTKLTQSDPDANKKIMGLARGIQTETGDFGAAGHQNFLQGRVASATGGATSAARATPPQAAAAPFETEISDPVYEEVEEPDSTQEMQDRVEEGMFNYYNIPQALFDEMTDERGHMLDVATIFARANAASPSYLGMRGMFNEDRAAMEASDPSYLGMRGMFNEDRAANAVRTPNYSGVKALFTEPKPSPPAAETSYAEMRTLFNPSLDPSALEARREARAAYQESSEASFSGNMRSLFCENRPKSVAEELGLPEAPGEKYVTGLTELEDLYEAEQEEAAAARAYTGESEQMYSGNKATGELERMMNMSDEEENELMKDVRILDPANDPPLFPEPAPAPAAKKKNHWWQFWR